MTVRRLAKLLHERRPTQSQASWKRALNRYLEEDAPKPTVPSKATARLLAELLDEPADLFVRPQARETIREENERLRQELACAHRELDELRRSQRESG